MGVDVCYTNHAEADQDDMDTLLTLLGAAGVNYIMGVPGADDIMLGYQSTSFHDAHYLRQLLGLRPAPEFEAWLEQMQIARAFDRRLLPIGRKHSLLEQHRNARRKISAPVPRSIAPVRFNNTQRTIPSLRPTSPLLMPVK